MNRNRFSGVFLGVFLALFFCLPSAHAATGFVNSPLWITPEKPNEGDEVTLSALFHNAESSAVSGSILFYDGNVLLAEKQVILHPDEVATVSTSFKISAGTHVFSASTKNMQESSTTGSLQVITVPNSVVKLPLQFVPKTITLAAAADGTAASGDSTSIILKQVDKAQASVLSALPAGTKKTVANTVNAVDNWRSSNAETFTKKSTAAKRASTTSPFTYVKYILFSGLSWLFSSAIIFYVAGLLIIYFLFRTIFRKLRKRKKSAIIKK